MTMSSTSNKLMKRSSPTTKTQTTTPRSSHAQRRSQASRACRRAPGRRTCCSSEKNRDDDVSNKLEALKNLIPSEHKEVVKADQLFQETADYIMLLRSQVVVLQTLIHIYAPPSSTTSPDHHNQNAV